jgi:hypothetical protein
VRRADVRRRLAARGLLGQFSELITLRQRRGWRTAALLFLALAAVLGAGGYAGRRRLRRGSRPTSAA